MRAVVEASSCSNLPRLVAIELRWEQLEYALGCQVGHIPCHVQLPPDHGKASGYSRTVLRATAPLRRPIVFVEVKNTTGTLKIGAEHVLLTGQLFTDIRSHRRLAADQMIGVTAECMEQEHGHPHQVALRFLPVIRRRWIPAMKFLYLPDSADFREQDIDENERKPGPQPGIP